MDSSSGDTDSSNFVYNLIDLPSPPQVPPTKIQGEFPYELLFYLFNEN